MAGIEYATLDDLKSLTIVDSADEERASALLAASSNMVAALLSKSGIPTVSEDSIDVQNRKTVVCQMVSRALSVSEDVYGVTQQQQMAGSYMTLNTFANPSGDLYISASEKKLLGIGTQRGKWLMPFGDQS